MRNPLFHSQPKPTPSTLADYDVAIIGGSFAGLSMAMALGRALRSVVVIDSGQPANRFAPEAHNILVHDGSDPLQILEKARAACLRYPTISVRDGLATCLRGNDGAFTVTLSDQRTVRARKVGFATGLQDLLLEIPGYSACWGKSVIHCPYCHGYEYAHQVTGILANGIMADHYVPLIRNWTDKLILFTNGQADLKDQQRLSSLATIVDTPLSDILHDNGQLHTVVLSNGERVEVNALYHSPPFEQQCLLPAEMYCEFTDMGHIKVDQTQQTTIPGIYAAGDCTTPMRSVPVAIAAGNVAGAMINHALVEQQVFAVE